MRRLVTLAVLLILAGAGGYAAWQYWQPTEAAAAPSTVAVRRGSVESTVLASGSLQASQITSVGAEVSGTIKTVAVKLGDVVEAGDTIAEIDSLGQQNAVKSAEASLANITAQRRAQQAQVEKLRQALDRSNQLKERNLVSDADYQTAATDLEAGEAQVAAMDAQISQATLTVDNAKLDLSRTTITAPVGGTIVALLVTEGQTVNAAQTTPTIVKIADLSEMTIKAQISEADVTRVRAGQSAYFTILGEPDRRIEAELRSIEPAPDAISSADSGISSSDNAIYYNGLFGVNNAEGRLRIAMTAQVTIVIDAVQDALVIPAAALGRQGPDGRYMVQAYDAASGTIAPLPVEIGLNNSLLAEVKSGLAEGDQIVTTGGGGARPAASGGRPRSALGGGLLGGGGPPPGRP